MTKLPGYYLTSKSLSTSNQKVTAFAALGHFDCRINEEQSELLSSLIWEFRRPEQDAVLSCYTFDHPEWEEVKKLGWQILSDKTFVRKAIFPRTIEYGWVLGHCPSREGLSRALRLAWNISGNETVIVLVGGRAEVGSAQEIYVDGIGNLEDNELCWVANWPFVFSRDHDGLTLRIYTQQLSVDQLLAKLSDFLTSRQVQFQKVSVLP